MTSTKTMPKVATLAASGGDSSPLSKASKKRLRASSEAHEKPAPSSPLPTTREKVGRTASAKTPAASDARDTALEQPRQTKASVVEGLLTREGGASLEALCEATGWQTHTCRAFLTGLRKKGRELTRASDKEGKSIYLIASARSNAPAPATEQTEAESN